MAVAPRELQFEIRRMQPADLPQVMEIERLSFPSPWSRHVLQEEIEREWARLDVVRERRAGKIVGFANYWLVRDEVHILSVATHPDHRRSGVGALMMQNIVDFAHSSRCRYVTLEVRRSNIAAHGLYRRFAFTQAGVRPRYYAENGEDAIVMLRELDRGAR